MLHFSKQRYIINQAPINLLSTPIYTNGTTGGYSHFARVKEDMKYSEYFISSECSERVDLYHLGLGKGALSPRKGPIMQNMNPTTGRDPWFPKWILNYRSGALNHLSGCGPLIRGSLQLRKGSHHIQQQALRHGRVPFWAPHKTIVA